MVAALVALAPAAGRALDLDAARERGLVLSQALQLGAGGDWDGAQALVAPRGDRLLDDLVLWRRLRAGAGTVEDYQGLIGRRPHWPGQEALARAVYGVLPPERPEAGLTGRAAQNWSAFDDAWRRGDYDEAERLLDQVTVDASGLGRPEAWEDRRRRLSRRAAREGRTELGYRLASRHFLGPEAGYGYADLEWVAGWIALRRLSDPARAIAHFERFSAAVETPISRARADYWLGRAHAARGDEAAAAAAWARAAQHQTTFYGQLAAAGIGAPGDPALTSTDLPDWRRSPAMRADDVAMAAILHFAGQEGLAFQSFAGLGETFTGEAALGALGRLALELGRPNYAVRIAKMAAGRGIVLHPAYYPLHPLAGYASEIEPALAMSIARQETELNPAAVSPAGARGLMQLMPGTARKVAGAIGEPYEPDRLTADWQYNARLGQRYLAEQIADHGGSYVLAAAAYNAGPHRVASWIARYGDPRDPAVDVIDWIEDIPFNETRNYVQRVIEGLYVYRTRISGVAGPMTIGEDLARGRRG